MALGLDHMFVMMYSFSPNAGAGAQSRFYVSVPQCLILPVYPSSRVLKLSSLAETLLDQEEEQLWNIPLLPSLSHPAGDQPKAPSCDPSRRGTALSAGVVRGHRRLS